MLILGLEDPVDLEDQVLEVEGLGEELCLGRGASGLQGHRREAGDEHDPDVWVDGAGFLSELDPVHFGHDNVGQKQVELLAFEQRHRFGAAADRGDFVADSLQRSLQIFAHRRIVFCQKDSRHGFGLCSEPIRFARSEYHTRALQRLTVRLTLVQILTVTPLAPPIIHQPRGDLPVLLSVPHSGRDYPDWLVAMASGGRASLTSLEDPLVDRLVWRALGRGVGAVIARAPRAAIDCNRAEDEIDPAVIEGGRRDRLTARARGGLGIVPARTPHHGYLWRRSVTPRQLNDRLDQAHRPYHKGLDDLLALLLDRFGCALLLDCHSMPPPPAGIPPIVFGDRRGRTADGWISAEATQIARSCGLRAGLNEPFAGGHVIERHSDPGRGVHALQIEIDRRAYLDRSLREPGPGFDRMAGFIETLAGSLGDALLGRRFATAAE